MTLSRTVLCILAGLTLAAAGTGAGASADQLAQIEATRTLRVCIWPDYYGVSFRNPKTQQLTGFDVDNATELARTLGVAVQFVDSSFTRFSDDLLGDRCDIAMFGIAPTAARLQKLRFAQPHMASDIVAVTTKGNRLVQRWSDIDRPGIVVAVVKGSTHEAVMAERLQHATLRALDSAQSREQEVLAGRADLFTADVPYTRRLLDHSEWARLVLPPAPFHVTPYAWAMRPGDDRFHARVERALADFKRDGRLAAHARRYGLEQLIVTK